MKWDVILLIVICSIFLIALIFLGIYLMFRKRECGFEAINDPKRIQHLLSYFKDSPILKTINENNCSQDYMIISKTVRYKIKPGNKEYKEEISTKITQIEYYKKQK